mmetsp:Transcript_56782/g.149403  ORF Transcript_56782/g.149403 Transcript_56782/m.149403 type:complete len:915 (-) Transcript_56782:268-3012(-)
MEYLVPLEDVRELAGRDVLGGAVRELEVPPAVPLAAGAARRGAVAPGPPGVPGAVELAVARAGALPDLLPVEGVAALASVGRVVDDGPGPLPLSVALRALAPRTPLAVLAVDRQRSAAAIPGTLLDLGERIVAGLAIVEGMLHDGAHAHVLAALAAGAADAPLAPLAQEAVDVGSVRAAQRHLLTLARVAWVRLLQRAHAEGAGAAAVLPDRAGAAHDAVAGGGAGAPFLPAVEDAVPRRLAVGVDRAELCLPVLAFGLLAALVGHLHDLAVPEHGATGAGNGARMPRFPDAPLAVVALLVAALEVAGLDNLLLKRLAGQAARGCHHGDVALPRASAAVARGAALAPVVPGAPLAVARGTVWALLADLRLPELEEAAGAALAAEADHLAVAGLHAGAARLGAGAPLAPARDQAVAHVAGLQVAPLGLDELWRAHLAPVRRELVDLALPTRLPSAAGLVTRVPRRPLGDDAVDGVLEAALCHRQRAHAGHAAPHRGLPEGALAAALPVGPARRPSTPRHELAVLSDRLRAAVAVAGLNLRKAPGAHLAAAGREGGDLARAQPGAVPAALAAGQPLLPPLELARQGVDDVAGHGLVERAAAGHAAVIRLLVDLPRAVPLAELEVGAGAPLGPRGELAVLGGVARGGAPLRREQGAVARLAELVVRDHDGALALAQAHAGGRVPVAPLAEHAVHRRPVPAAALDEGALGHLQLGARAPAALPALEEEGVAVRVGQEIHGAALQRGLLAAARSAVQRLRPLAPGTEEVLGAVAGAVRRLLRGRQLAGLAALVRQLLDGAVPEALPAALRAVAPRRPGVELAVLADDPLARLRVAGLRGGDAGLARLAAALRGPRDGALPLRLAAPARGRARRPVLPQAHLAVRRRLLLALVWQLLALLAGVAGRDHLQGVVVAQRAVA